KSFLQIVEAATERPISVAAQNTNASRQSGTGAGTAIISDTPTQNNNDGGGGAGYGTDTSQDAGEVTGYEMTVVYDDSVSGIRDFLQSPSFAASSLMAIVFIIVLVGAVFYGFKRK
ncbi:MAG: hypothetical protein FWH46_05140, partial [Methanimicrococcus sp.]|nr:hypothetical protein [Methanimicrococcus sp.]